MMIRAFGFLPSNIDVAVVIMPTKICIWNIAVEYGIGVLGMALANECR